MDGVNGSSIFWDDLNDNLDDPDFAIAFDEAVKRIRELVKKDCFWCGASTEDGWVTDPDHEAGICFIAGQGA